MNYSSHHYQGPGPLAGLLSLAFLFAIGTALALLCRLAVVITGAL